MSELTDAAFDRLALDACETIGYKGGQIAAYDVAGYQRIERREVAPQDVPRWDIDRQAAPPLPRQATFEETPHLVRIGGFRRHRLYSPDEIGSEVREAGIPWNDGLGNGMYESLLIHRKYGFNHVLEAPLFGYPLPFLPSEWPRFEEEYQRQLAYMASRLREMEAIYGRSFAAEKVVCVLNCYETPLSLFAAAYARDCSAVQQALYKATGRETPPVEPQTAADRLALSRFWAFVRRQQALVLRDQKQALRQMLGPNAVFVGNFHELPQMDMAMLGQIYDHPAVAVRPLLLENEVMVRHYTAYFTQLFHDLSGKRPLVSVRLNLSAAGARFVPGANLIGRWHDQATRHGAGGFYLWPRDYPMDVSSPYDGPMQGNPVANTLPHVRWDSSLQLLGALARSRRLQMPGAAVAILVPRDAALLQRREWRRIFAAFSACAEARLHARFIADWQVTSGGIPPDVRLLLAPELEFVQPALRKELEAFTAAGGLLLLAAGELADERGDPAPPIAGVTPIDAQLFDLFPLHVPARMEALQHAAEFLRREVEERDIEDNSWLFDVSVANLPPSTQSDLRPPQPQITFAHWMYEHGSDWVFPYLNKAT